MLCKVLVHNFDTVLDLIDQFLDIIAFPAFRMYVGLKIRSDSLNWLSFENISQELRLLYESNVLLPAITENDFAVMPAR